MTDNGNMPDEWFKYKAMDAALKPVRLAFHYDIDYYNNTMHFYYIIA